MQSLRAAAILAAFLAFTLPLMPVQHAFKRLGAARARTFPHWYHRCLCRLLGVRIHVTGALAEDRPVLLVANHVSWLDIPVLSAVAPVSFVAKREVAGWPLAGTLARLQRTVFIDRQRRGAVRDACAEIMARLKGGDHIVLFAEGTSSDGNAVLPFRSSLFAAVKPGGEEARALAEGVSVQTLAIAYTRLHGIPLGRRGRPFVAWYGDMRMAGHAWQLLKRGPLDVELRIGPPVPLDRFADRKALTRHTERDVRAHVAALLSPRRAA